MTCPRARAERARLTGEDAVEAWADAADRWRGRENPYLVAYCRWREAEARLRAGARAGAVEALSEARQIARRLRAAPLASEIDALAA
jgi:hypothetical protein